MKLEASILPRDKLARDLREEMLALHSRHFDNVQRSCFMRDLDKKDWVILLRRPDKTVAGFSTQRLLTLRLPGGTVRFLYSGDTIVDRTHWNTPLLAGCFGHLMLRLIQIHGPDNLYWFLITKGFRTYRFLPVFFHRYWPAADRITPVGTQSLLDTISTRQFGETYDRSTGLIRPRQGDHLTSDLARIPPSRLRDPHVAFFLSRNPGYASGDELACLAPIREDNLNSYARRVIQSTTPAWLC